MVLRPRSQRPMPASADRARRCHLQAFIAARCAAPMASVPISAITPLLVQLSTARPLPEPVTMAQATAVGAAAGGVGAGAARWLPGHTTVTRLTAMAMAPVIATRLTPMAMAPGTATRPTAMAMAGALSAAVSMPPLGIVGAKAD